MTYFTKEQKNVIIIYFVVSFRCQNMFYSVDTQALESHLDKTSKRSQDKNDKVVSQMQNLCDSMKSSTDKMATNVPHELKKQISISVARYVNHFEFSRFKKFWIVQ